jgi:hypothetical protein
MVEKDIKRQDILGNISLRSCKIKCIDQMKFEVD